MKIWTMALCISCVVAWTSAGDARPKPRHGHAPPPVTGTSRAMPADAQQILAGLARRRARIFREAEAKLLPHRQQAVRELKVLQDRYTRAGKLDAALAIRAQVRAIAGIRKDPGHVSAQPKDVGRSYLYEVVGATTGGVWGTSVYTTDSHLATAAVHAGVLRKGQRGVVRVRILQGRQSYAASTANGVRSQSYGAWSTSFTVEAASSP